MRHQLLSLPLILSLAACGGGGGGGAGAPLPEGVPVPDGGFTTYRTTPPAGYDLGPQNRVQHNLARPGDSETSDAKVLADFDTTGKGPAGYRNMMADVAGLYERRDVVLEVIAELDSGGTKAARLIRVTADQSLLQNERNGRVLAASGKFHFRGQVFAWVTIDNGPMLSGHHPEGLVDMSVDFASQTADISLRTANSETSDVEVTLNARGLPFNIRTGAFGGDVTMVVRTPTLGTSGDIAGSLRGNVGGKPVWTEGKHELTTSGLFSGEGSSAFSGEKDGPVRDVQIEGLWFGRDEKLP